jgi:hypothetical protein
MIKWIIQMQSRLKLIIFHANLSEIQILDQVFK